MSEPGEGARADVEIGAGWSARSARWHASRHSPTEARGDVETEELSERERLPERPAPGHLYRDVARRWRFSAWLRPPSPSGGSRGLLGRITDVAGRTGARGPSRGGGITGKAAGVVSGFLRKKQGRRRR